LSQATVTSGQSGGKVNTTSQSYKSEKKTTNYKSTHQDGKNSSVMPRGMSICLAALKQKCERVFHEEKY
jgi:hypothetical protein